MTGIKIYHSTCVPPMGKLKYELNSDICMPDSLLSRLCEKIERSLYLKSPFSKLLQLEFFLRWLNRVIQDHQARASDLSRKLIFSFFLLHG